MRWAALWLAAGLVAGTAAPARAQDEALGAAVRDFDARFALDPSDSRIGDFDGDGRDDVAAILRSPDKRAFVVFHARQTGYVAYPLYAALPAGDVELRLVAPGSRRVVGSPGVVEFETPGLELVFPGRSSALYVWRNGRYQSFGTESH